MTENDLPLLLRLHRVTADLSERLAPELDDLKPIEALTLVALQARPHGASVGMIRELTGGPASTMTGVLKRVERMQLIARIPDPQDYRGFWLGLTPTGEEATRDLRHILRDLEERLFRKSPSGVLEETHATLDHLDEATEWRTR